MPNREFHCRTSTIIGATAAFCRTESRRPAEIAVEVIGGAIGGNIGGRLPDILDPPFSPNHRSLAHGVLSAGPLLLWIMQQLERGQAWCRNEAARHASLV